MIASVFRAGFSLHGVCGHLKGGKRFGSSWTFKDIVIPTPYGHLAAKDWGNPNDRPFIALHGWQDNAATFDRLIPLLNPKYRIIALDLTGHGLSSHLAKGHAYTPNQYLLDVQRCAQFFGWDEFSILGHSMGGGVGHMFSMVCPSAIKTLVTLDVTIPGPVGPERFMDATMYAMLNLLRQEEINFSKPRAYCEEEIIAKHMAAIRNAYTADAVRVLMTRGCTQISDDRYAFNRDPKVKYMFWNSFDAETSEICVPRYKNELLAIRAIPMTRSERYEKFQELYKRNCSRYEYHEVNGLHHVHLIEPEKVAPIINRFLDASS